MAWECLPAERDLRYPAMVALVRIGKASVPAVQKVLKSKSPEARENALVVLVNLRGDAAPAVPQIAEALHDENPTVRYYAARALGAIGPPAKSAVKALERATKDSDAAVRKVAREALERLNSSPARPAKSKP